MTRPTIEFHVDGAAGGSTGVNRITRTWSQVVELVEFGPLATTRMAGSPEAMELESRSLAVLAGRCTATVGDERLTMEGESGWLGLSRIVAG